MLKASFSLSLSRLTHFPQRRWLKVRSSQFLSPFLTLTKTELLLPDTYKNRAASTQFTLSAQSFISFHFISFQKLIRCKYLYKYIQMRHREKTKQTNKQTNKQTKRKTIILLIIKIMNNYNNKNDKIR